MWGAASCVHSTRAPGRCAGPSAHYRIHLCTPRRATGVPLMLRPLRVAIRAVMSVDENRGLVFAATGSASPGFYGGRRSGGNRYADSLIALDAAGGQLIWQQQLVHHDLWNYD